MFAVRFVTVCVTERGSVTSFFSDLGGFVTLAQTNAERQAAFKERKRLEAEQAELEELVNQERREQEVRDRFGYSASEVRTERERSDAAARMLGRDPVEYWEGRLLDDRVV